MVRPRRSRWMTSAAAFAAALLAGGTVLRAQGVTPERGAAALGSALAGIGTTGRVLTIAAHPDDEDTPIIAWLARGRHVETAYLSLTRGDGGQNLIGNELGEALGAIRTQELLSARRIDGGRQYFTRAYDFGFSKNAEETYLHWPKDSILGDVIRVVRAFRPHVMVGFFSGTPRDGHGHHQVSGMLAREAYELAGDTVRFPVAGFGLPWTPQKFYRSARQLPDSATLRVNTGEYDALLGRSYYEIAAESRSQHKSQGFGVLQRKGAIWGYLSREVSRVGPSDVRMERDLFDGVDTTWVPLRAEAPVAMQPVLDSALAAVAQARASYRAQDPSPIVAPLARVVSQLRRVRDSLGQEPPALLVLRDGIPPRMRRMPPGTRVASAPLYDALTLSISRAERALVLAAGVAVEATAPRATFPLRDPVKNAVDDSLPVTMTVYNRGVSDVTVAAAYARRTADSAVLAAAVVGALLAPDSAVVATRFAVADEPTWTWWRVNGRDGNDWFRAAVDARDEQERENRTAVLAYADLTIAGVPVTVTVPVVNRFADPIRGDQQVPVAAVPGITIGLENVVEYIRAGVPVDREFRVAIQSAYPEEARVIVQLLLPKGLVADSVERTRTLGPGARATVVFRLRGTLAPGRHQLGAMALHEGSMSTSGYYTIAYDHITTQRLYGVSGMYLSAVNVKIPTRALVGYVKGSGDLGLEALKQLDIAVEPIEPAMLGTTNLARFTAIVLGPRAYESSEELVRQNPRLLQYANNGGTLVVQYGAQNMNNFKVTPYPLQWAPRAARVTMENAPVKVLQPTHPLLTTPNRIGAPDWADWVQERATYVPSVIDKRYTSLLAMNDPDEPEQQGALLVAPVGKGRYVYVTLALFRQLPNGVPGAARILANLINAPAPVVPPKR